MRHIKEKIPYQNKIKRNKHLFCISIRLLYLLFLIVL
eukprot:UN19023